MFIFVASTTNYIYAATSSECSQPAIALVKRFYRQPSPKRTRYNTSYVLLSTVLNLSIHAPLFQSVLTNTGSHSGFRQTIHQLSAGVHSRRKNQSFNISQKHVPLLRLLCRLKNDIVFLGQQSWDKIIVCHQLRAPDGTF